MQEAIGNRVGVFRTAPRRRFFLRMPILIALVGALAILINSTKRGPDTSNLDLATMGLVVWAAACGLLFLGLWLITTLLWKVTLFEGGVRGPTYNELLLPFRTLAWGEIISAERIPFLLQSINAFQSVLRLHPSRGPGIVIYEPLGGMQEFKEHVRRLAGEDHPLARLLHEP
jgi:hypothetical protein